MKIVFIGPFGLQPKGTMSARALPLAQALAARGHRITMLLPPWDDPERMGQSWEDNGVRVVNIALPWRLPLFFHLGLTGGLVAQALALKPETVHLFKPKAYAGLAHVVIWWLRRLGGPSLKLVVDTDDWEQAWNEVIPYSPGQKKLFAWQERWGLGHADAVTAASRALETLAIAQRGDDRQVFYLPNGCCAKNGELEGDNTLPLPAAHTDRLSAGAQVRQKWQLGEAPVILLYSRFWEFRPERIVTLVGAVAAQLPQARWLMVGQGMQGEDQRLTEQLAAAGLAEYARFAGWQPLEETPAYFAAAQVAVYPYDDTPINRAKCSVKLIDLLAAGVPVVADAVGQNTEYINHNVSGMLTPPQDDQAMAGALINLLQHPQQRQRLGQTARQQLAEKFNWAHLAQIAERAYSS